MINDCFSINICQGFHKVPSGCRFSFQPVKRTQIAGFHEPSLGPLLASRFSFLSFTSREVCLTSPAVYENVTLRNALFSTPHAEYD